MTPLASGKIRSGAVRSMAGAALVVLVTLGAAPASGPPLGPEAMRGVQDTTLAQRRPLEQRRPFEHQRHESLACRECHGSGGAHRVTRIQRPSDCAACHHDPGRALACAECHAKEAIPAERATPLTFRLKVADSLRTREVPFRHQAHVSGDAALQCTECHATPVTMARNRECAACHAPHHSGKATCSSCHSTPRSGVHQEGVHLSCAGGACHDAKAPAPTSSRALCLYCHANRRNHEPEGNCALCHRIPGAAAPGGATARPGQTETRR